MPTRSNDQKLKKLEKELAELRNQLLETKDTLQAIQQGSVDAFVVAGAASPEVVALKGADQPYHLLIEAMNEGAVTLSADGTILFCNKRFIEMLKKPLNKILGSNLYSFVEEKDHKRLETLLGQKKIIHSRQEFLLQISKKSKLSVEFSIRQLNLPGLKSVYIIIVTDITERKKAAQAISDSEELYRRLFESSPDGILIFREDKIAVANPAFRELIGAKTEQEIVNKPIFDFVHPDYKAMKQKRIELLMDKGYKFVPRTEEKWLRLNGETMDVMVTSALATYQGKPAIQSIVQDVTEQKKTETQLSYLASHDPLTGLYNRSWLGRDVNKMIEMSDKGTYKLILFLVNIDGFKEINASHGIFFGDSLLQSIAKRISENVRGTDVLGRVEIDSFAIISTELSNEKAIAIYAEKILNALAEPFLIQNKKLMITASAGISQSPKDGKDYEALLKSAEIALYQAKESRVTYHFYKHQQAKAISSRVSLESDLRNAIKAKEFFLVYQPKVEINSGRIYGVETLIRWKRANGSVVPPNVFMAVAENTDLILPIGEWVLKTACEQQKAWFDKGLSLHLAVNISAKQFQHKNFESMLTNILHETRIDPTFLELEITESAFIQEITETQSLLRSLSKYGIKFSIDDFGVGYSSLNYLKYFTVDRLKIDHSFVRDIGHDASSEAIILATITMGHSLNMKVIAEGVETKEQLDFLKRHQCDEIQGFYVSQGIVAEKIPKLLSDFSKKKNELMGKS